VKIQEIKEQIEENKFILTFHAHEERQAELISVEDIKEAILSGEII